MCAATISEYGLWKGTRDLLSMKYPYMHIWFLLLSIHYLKYLVSYSDRHSISLSLINSQLER